MTGSCGHSDTATTPLAAFGAHRRSFLGHPWGLAYLAVTDGWVAFSFYGMQSLLVLYLVGELLKPGHIEHVIGFEPFRAGLEILYGPLSGQPLASAITGVYAALIYACPILAGLAADRWLGRRITVTIGCILMTVGHFLMAFDVSFLIALACLVAGAGCAGSLKAQIGDLYGISDPRRADAFQLDLLIISAAVIFSPLVCGTLGEKVGWSWGFGAAGIGMLIGLVIYLAGGRWMPKELGRVPRSVKRKRPPLTASERRTVAVLVLLLPVFALATVGNMEIFNAYLVWGKANFQLEFFGQTMPISWLLSLDAFVSIGTIALSMAFWRWWSRHRREPDEIVKVVIGTLISALAPLILALASQHSAAGHRVGLVWGLSFHIVNDIGFANVYAVGLALYSRAAPPSLGATVVNAYSLSLFLANLMVAGLAGLLSQMSGSAFWLLHAGLVFAAAVMMLICARLFHGTLAPESRTDIPCG